MQRRTDRQAPLLLLLSVALVVAVLGLLLPAAQPAAPLVPVGFTDTPTPVPTDTPTLAPPTPTFTPVPPTPTFTSVPPTPVPTDTPTPVPPTPTFTPIPPTIEPTSPVPTAPAPITPTPGQPTATPAPVLQDPFIIKQVNLAQAQPGDIVIFAIEVINPNPVSLSNVTVSDALSPLVDYVSASVPRGTFSFDPSSRVWTLTLGTMAPNERLTFTITARVNEQAQPPNTLLNTAVLTTSRGVTQSNTTNTLIVPRALPGTGRR